MSPLDIALRNLRDELLRQIDLSKFQPATFKVATTAPFTVYLNGASTGAVAGIKVNGQTYAVNDRGIAIICDGSLPICLKLEV